MEQIDIKTLISQYNATPWYVKETFLENCSKEEADILIKYEDILLDKIKEDSSLIKNISNPSERIQLEIIKQNPDNLLLIDSNNRSFEAKRIVDNIEKELTQLETVKKDGLDIKHIKNPSEKIQLEAIKENSFAIKYIENPTETTQLAAVRKNGGLIEYIKNPSEITKLEAIKSSKGTAIKYIKNPTEEMKLEAVKGYPWIIQYIENPSEFIQVEAMKKNDGAFRYIENIKLETCYEALKENPYLLMNCLKVFEKLDSSSQNNITKEDVIKTAINSFKENGQIKDYVTEEIDEFNDVYRSDDFLYELNSLKNDKDISDEFKEEISNFLEEEEFVPEEYENNYDSLDSVE